MPISDQKLHRFAQRTLAIGLLIISIGAALQVTFGSRFLGIDPMDFGSATMFGLLARVGGTIALIGLIGFGLRAARRPADSITAANHGPQDSAALPPYAQRGDSAPAPRLPSRIRPVRIPSHQVEHSA